MSTGADCVMIHMAVCDRRSDADPEASDTYDPTRLGTSSSSMRSTAPYSGYCNATALRAVRSRVHSHALARHECRRAAAPVPLPNVVDVMVATTSNAGR